MPKHRAVEPEGHKHRIDDDVEGHGGKLRAAGDDDVEGHGGKLRAAGDDDDAEGHMMGNPLLNQQLARAREQDIQRSLRTHEVRSEASRPHKK